MKIGEVEYTNLTDDFGYWTVELKDIRTYLPINIANQPNTYNPFTGWNIADEVKEFMEDVIRKVAIPKGENLRSVVGWGNYFADSSDLKRLWVMIMLMSLIKPRFML